MKGKDGMRACRAKGGGVFYAGASSNVAKEAEGDHPDNEADDAIKRGHGRIHRKRGGHVAKSEFEEEKHDAEEGGEGMKKGGRAKRKHGGMIDGEGHKPHMGRAGRRHGGKASADLHPVTHDAGVKPKHRKIMSEGEATP